MQTHEASKVISALRNGSPPVDFAEQILSGRQPEIDEFNRCLNSLDTGESSVKMILGEYGTGKSHLINAMKNIALKQDYIITSFQVNNGFRLNKIDDLYYAIMHNLIIKNREQSKTSFNEIFDLWIENLQSAPFPDRKRIEINAVCQEISKYNMTFARAFLMFMRGRIQRNHEMLEVTSAWLTGERHIPYELKQKYDLIGHVEKTDTLDFLKAFAKLIHLLGYRGLVIFIDELDQVTFERKDIRLQAYNNLKQLIDMTATGDLLHTLFVFSGTPELVKDEEKGIPSLESLAQRLSLSSSPEYANPMQTVIELVPLTTSQLHWLAEKILSIYAQQTTKVDKLPTLESLLQTMASEQDTVTRSFVTRAIQYLDACVQSN